MKFTCLFLLACIVSCTAFSQRNPTDLDKSPLDISYYPPNYPILKLSGKASGQPLARIIYSRPQKEGRNIFGGVVIYNNVWRLGANEATEIELFKPAKINGKTLPKGRYTMFAICDTGEWKIIFNQELDIWGLGYNPKKDVMSVQVPVQLLEKPVDPFTMYFDDKGKDAVLNIIWDNVKVSVPFSFT